MILASEFIDRTLKYVDRPGELVVRRVFGFLVMAFVLLFGGAMGEYVFSESLSAVGGDEVVHCLGALAFIGEDDVGSSSVSSCESFRGHGRKSFLS